MASSPHIQWLIALTGAMVLRQSRTPAPIGRHLTQALLRAGHHVVCATRTAPQTSAPNTSYICIDFNKANQPQDWTNALAGVDVVVNAVGIIRETAKQNFNALHRDAPIALFKAAATANVTRIVQISALGADENAVSRYHLSKKSADDYLRTLPVSHTIIQPSLVYGPGGASAALFDKFASMPLIPLPGTGDQTVQPVHIDDVTQALLKAVESDVAGSVTIPVVGPQPVTLREFYGALRQAMGFSRLARFISVPIPIMKFVAKVGNRIGGLIDEDTLGMLVRGNTADVRPIRALLGRDPLHPTAFIAKRYANAAATHARMRWMLPVLRWSIAVVWIFTGIVSLGVYPVAQSYELLARSDVPAFLQPVFLYGAAALDIVLGVLALLPRRHRSIWLVQGMLVLGYTAIITLKLPEFWLHPYGPVLKNLPFLAVLWVLYEFEDRPWNT